MQKAIKVLRRPPFAKVMCSLVLPACTSALVKRLRHINRLNPTYNCSELISVRFLVMLVELDIGVKKLYGSKRIIIMPIAACAHYLKY